MKDKIEIDIEYEKYSDVIDGDYYVGSIQERHLEGCICQAKSLEELKDELKLSMKVAIDFYQQDSVDYMKRAIWRSNKGERTFWFTMIGIGFNFVIVRKTYPFDIPIKYGWKNFGIRPKGGIKIGRLLFSFINHWNIKK